MEKDKIIRQLERENELLKARIEELEKPIAFYENAHTPPSLRRGFCGGTNGKNLEKSGGGKPGRKKGHRGVTRPQPEPQPVIVTKFKIAHYAYPRCHREVIATHPDLSQGGIRSVVHISFICNLSCFFGFSTPSKMSYNGWRVSEVCGAKRSKFGSSECNERSK